MKKKNKLKIDAPSESPEAANEGAVNTEEKLTDAELVEVEAMLTEYAQNEPVDKADEPDSSDEPKKKSQKKDEPEPLSPFEASIKNFSESDTGSDIKSTKKRFDIIRTFALLICFGIFVVSSYVLYNNINDKFRGEKIYSDIIDNFADGFTLDGDVKNDGGKFPILSLGAHAPYTPTMDDIIKNGVQTSGSHSDYSAELSRMRASLESLRNINPDIYGWIKVPGTNINYPIAQTTNNEYYLDHAYTGDNLVNGSIYADFRCDPLVTKNYNTVLYGHNITDGSMFNHVTKFFDETVFNNTLIYLYTFDGIFIFKPFSIHEADYDSGYIRMAFSPDQFIEFSNNLASLSDINTDRTFSANDRILTLSTCTNGLRTRRYALHAVLVDKITD